MKKILVSVSLISSLALTGVMTSCVDRNELVDEDSKPSWLGESIYAELSEPTQLTGTFSTYLRLIDDLGYTETLSRTGSKTVFPANDEAFERFFADNEWGVTSYNQLTTSQKKLLLYTSMLDNAILVSMLSNVSNGSTSVSEGQAVKHQTNVSVIDSVTHLYGATQMPQNNDYWKKYYNKGIDLVMDGTRPMIVHFTRSQMVGNSITYTGEGSDFQILTGQTYDSENQSAYVFDDKIINSDVTCQNGYIHQVEDVIVPPGNMAEVLRKSDETSLFSHIVDYYAAPYYNATITNNYNDWAVTNGEATIDSIFELRYLSSRSQEAALTTDPDGSAVGSGRYLKYDPGWNQYYPSHANSSDLDYTITDMGAFFVPSDDAVKAYFLPGGDGEYLIDIYGTKENTEANLIDNLDSMQVSSPSILTSFVRNLQQSSFVETVPSKFSTIINDASENMGMTVDVLEKNSDGTYNVKIANNGVIYVCNELIAPDEYRAVLAPSSSYPDMYVMNWAIQDATYLGVDFKYYLLAMSATYGLFLPDDDAFAEYYIDPTSLGSSSPRALKWFKYITNDRTGASELRCEVHSYNKNTGEIGSDVIETVRYNSSANAKYTTQLVDILNYHTLLLSDGEVIGTNHYYQTKHGGTIYVSGGSEGSYVGTSAQIDDDAILSPATIEVDYSQANGHAYRIDHVIQAPQKSVSSVLQANSQFSQFYELCAGFAAGDLLLKAGISDETNSFGTTEQDQYIIFTSNYGSGTSQVANACLDENVKMFNTYNYTLYAPNNDAVEMAHAAGLPRWSEIEEMLADYEDAADVPASVADEAQDMILAIRNFCRYHFQTGTVCVDNVVDSDEYSSLCSNALGISEEIDISGGSNRIQITDATGQTHTIQQGQGLVNQMARDYWFNSSRTSANEITTSSFCMIHELSTPLYIYTDGSGNPTWEPSVVAENAEDAKGNLVVLR